MLSSVWERDGERAEPARALSGTVHADTIVVGAGITGLTAALHLAEAGRSVVVVEAHTVGGGTTGRSTAKVSLLQGGQFSRVAARHDRGTLAAYAAANRAGQEWVVALAERCGVPVQRRTAWTYARTERGERALRRELRAAHRAGVDVQWHAETPLPFSVRGAIALDDQFQVDPLALVRALAERCREAGAEIWEHARVLTASGRDPVRVRIDHRLEPSSRADAVGEARRHTRTVTAGSLVLATGSPILDRGAFFARLEPSRSYSLAVRTRRPVRGMFLSIDAPSRSLRDVPIGDDATVDGEEALMLIGGEGHVTGRSRPTTARLDALRSWAGHHFPDMEETHAWSAQDYVTPHGLPYAGPLLPGRGDVLVAGGYSKWGMTNGVAAAAAVAADLLGDEGPAWSGALRSWGVHELPGLPGTARLNAEVALHLSSGWARRAGEEVLRRVGRTPSDAVGPVCTHLGGVTSWNDAERSWDCPLHGSRFTPDGEVIEGPATRPLGGLVADARRISPG